MPTSIPQQWLDATEGEVIDLGGAVYPRQTLKPSKRPKGSAPVTIRNGNLTRDVAVGSTDTLNLKSGVRDLILDSVHLEVDDRSGILSETPDGARKVSLLNCVIEGVGAGPHDGAWKNDSKWGQLHNRTGGWSEIGTVTSKVYQEHARYFHTPQGNHAFKGCVSQWCGRTAYQFVARMKETGVDQPVGYGDITIIDDVVRDVCLESGGGGYVYSFKGGCPTTNILIENSLVRLGCDSALAAPFNKNIAGVFLTESAPESHAGAGDGAHPGAYPTCKVVAPKWEVGTVYPGEGSARRSLAKVGNVANFLLEWGDGFIVQNGGNGIALEVLNSCANFRFKGAPSKWKGKLRYKGTEYPDWASFATANAALEA